MEYTFYTLCIADKRWETAEVKKGSKKFTTNPIN